MPSARSSSPGSPSWNGSTRRSDRASRAGDPRPAFPPHARRGTASWSSATTCASSPPRARRRRAGRAGRAGSCLRPRERRAGRGERVERGLVRAAAVELVELVERHLVLAARGASSWSSASRGVRRGGRAPPRARRRAERRRPRRAGRAGRPCSPPSSGSRMPIARWVVEGDRPAARITNHAGRYHAVIPLGRVRDTRGSASRGSWWMSCSPPAPLCDRAIVLVLAVEAVASSGALASGALASGDRDGRRARRRGGGQPARLASASRLWPRGPRARLARGPRRGGRSPRRSWARWPSCSPCSPSRRWPSSGALAMLGVEAELGACPCARRRGGGRFLEPSTPWTSCSPRRRGEAGAVAQLRSARCL